MSMDLFEMVANGKLSTEEAVDIMILESKLKQSFISRLFESYGESLAFLIFCLITLFLR